MGKYTCRFKGVNIKGAAKKAGKPGMPDGEDEAEMMEETPQKMKIGHPEKAVVKRMMDNEENSGLPTPNKKKAKKELGEKGSSKSGNYAHRGIPGHQGGSRPRGTAPMSGLPADEQKKLKQELKWLNSQDPSQKRDDRMRDIEAKLTGAKPSAPSTPAKPAPASDWRNQPMTPGQIIASQKLPPPIPQRTADQIRADRAKADYAAAHPESVAAHQAAGKPIKAAAPKGGAVTGPALETTSTGTKLELAAVTDSSKYRAGDKFPGGGTVAAIVSKKLVQVEYGNAVHQGNPATKPAAQAAPANRGAPAPATPTSQDIPTKGGASKPGKKGVYVKFDGVAGYHKLKDNSDEALERMKIKIEREIGKPIPMDDFQRSRHGFPSFDMYEDGEYTGGG